MRLLTILSCCAIAAPVFSQDAASEKKEPVQMEVVSPLALTQKPLAIQVRAGRWFPVAVTLSNTGDAVRGTLVLRLKDATGENRNPTEFFTVVDLPTNSNKRIWLYGRVERDDTDKFEVTFTGRGFKQKKSEGIVQNAEASTRVVLTISDSDEKLSYLVGLRGPGLGLPVSPETSQSLPSNPNSNSYNSQTPLKPLGAPHELVPSRWVGLDAADLVILQDFPHSALRPNQITALRGYAAAGGSILVLGGSNWQRLASSPLADLWPVTPQSSNTAAASDVSTLINRFARFPVMTGADRLGGAPVVATRGVLKPGCRVLLGDSDAPLLAVNDFGAGQVLFLSVDPTQPPFLGWRGLPRLWADLFRPTSRPPQIASVGTPSFDNQYGYSRGYPPGSEPSSQTSSTSALLEALATAPQMRTPPVSFIAWFLALYVFFLVPVNYVFLRYFDRRELAWVTIPVIVLGFSLMSYAAALRIKGTAILTRQVNLVQGAASVGKGDAQWARADAMLWLYSPRKTTYAISSVDPQMIVADYVSDEGTRVAIREPEENEAFALDSAPINMWDYRSFVGHSVADLKGGVRLIPQGNSLQIQNKTTHELKGVVLVSHGRLWAYKSIPSGATGSADVKYKDKVSLSNAQLAGRVENASRSDPNLYPLFSGEEKKGQPVGSTGFATIPSKLLNMALSDQWTTPSTFIVAWSDTPISGMTIGKEGAGAQNLSLIVLHVENDAALRPLLAANGERSTPNHARVHLLSSEVRNGAQGKAQGSIYTYEAELARVRAKQIRVQAYAALENQYGYPSYPGNANRVNRAPVSAEIFNVARGTWQSLRLQEVDKPSPTITSAPPAPSTDSKSGAPPAVAPAPNPQNKWKLAGVLSVPLAEQCVLKPDGRVQLRFTTTLDDVRVKGITVNNATWGEGFPATAESTSTPVP